MEIMKARVFRDENGNIYLEDETVGTRALEDFLSDIAGQIEHFPAVEIRFKRR